MIARSILAFALLALGACTSNEPLSLHGAGSMRVEVEVYKGPVSLSAAGQIGQVTAVIGETVRSLDQWKNEAYAISESRCQPVDRNGQIRRQASMDMWRDCQGLDNTIRSAREIIGAACAMIYSPAFTDFRAGTFLPIKTCEAARNAGSWAYLLKPDATAAYVAKWKPSLASDTDSAGISGELAGPAIIQLLTKKYKVCTEAYQKYAGIPAGLPPTSAGKVDAQLLKGATAKAEHSNVTGVDATEVEIAAKATLPEPGTEPARLSLVLDRETYLLRCYREPVVIALNSLATQLRSASFRMADGNVRYVTRDKEVRGMLVGFGYIGAEFGNQISSRVAVLEKELAGNRDARLLSTRDYLRDARDPDFVKLFDWLKAGDSRVSTPGGMTVKERIRMAEMLTADSYWEKVNEVYASGQGDVSMAFIKDELGNWNLKSFSNDPSELLQAYRAATDAALKATASLLAQVGSGGGSTALAAASKKMDLATRASGLADRLAGGETASVDTGEVADLHAAAVARLNARAERMKGAQTDLAVAKTAAEKDVASAAALVATATGNADQAAISAPPGSTDAALIELKIRAQISLTDATKRKADADLALETAEKQIADFPRAVVAAMKDVVEDYRATLSEREGAIAQASAPAKASTSVSPPVS